MIHSHWSVTEIYCRIEYCREKLIGHRGTVLLVWPRSGVRLKQGWVSPGARGPTYSVLAACRGRLRGTAMAAAGTRHYWLGSTGWDQPIQSTSEPRPIGPPELQNPTALLLSSAKKDYFSFPRQMFSKWKFEILGWKRLEEGKYHVWLSWVTIVIIKSPLLNWCHSEL